MEPDDVDKILVPCITPKYIYLRVVEIYANRKDRVGTADVGNGSTYSEPDDGQMVVALVRKGKSEVVEERRPGAITLDEYIEIKRTLRSIEELDNQSF